MSSKNPLSSSKKIKVMSTVLYGSWPSNHFPKLYIACSLTNASFLAILYLVFISTWTIYLRRAFFTDKASRTDYRISFFFFNETSGFNSLNSSILLDVEFEQIVRSSDIFNQILELRSQLLNPIAVNLRLQQF